MCSRLRNGSDVISWSKVVDKLHRSFFGANPIKIRVWSINELADRDDIDFRVGDELIVYEAKTKDVQLNVAEERIEDEDEECIRVPVDLPCLFKVVPMYNQTNSKVFGSVCEMLDIFPAIDDVIYSVTQFTVGKVQIQAWDRLQVLSKFQDSSGAEFLEVKTERHGQNLMLPSELEKKFVQMNADIVSPLAEPLSMKEYRLKELSKYWTPQMGRMKIRLLTKNEEPPEKEQTPTFPVLFKRKKAKSRAASVDEPKKYDEHWMIPNHWRNRIIEMVPIKIVYALKCSLPGSDIVISGSFKMDVEVLDYNAGDARMFTEHKRRSSSGNSSEGTSSQLQDLDLDSIFPVPKSGFALTAVVTSGATASLSKIQSPIRYRNTIAIHRVRKIQKLLLTSPEMQHYLVTPNYGGLFKTIPPVYETVADIPQMGDVKYVTKRTSYPKEKQLEHCREGEIVQFLKMTENEIGGITTRLVHCLVSAAADLPSHAATYPDYLCGKFEPINQSAPKELKARDLFKYELPCHVRLTSSDTGLGFDPLFGKKTFIVQEVVTEFTAIVGSARPDAAGRNQLVEVPTCRGTLTVESTEGNLQVPFTTNFNGHEKLPTVEIITYGDVESLRRSNARLKSRMTKKEKIPPVKRHNSASEIPGRPTTLPPLPTTRRRVSEPIGPNLQSLNISSPMKTGRQNFGFDKSIPEYKELTPPEVPRREDEDEEENIYTKMHMLFKPPLDNYTQVAPKCQRHKPESPTSPMREKVKEIIEEEDEPDYIEPEPNDPPTPVGEMDEELDDYVKPQLPVWEPSIYTAMTFDKPVPKPRKSIGETQSPYDVPRFSGGIPHVEEANSSDEEGYEFASETDEKITITEPRSPRSRNFEQTPAFGPPRLRKPTVYRRKYETDC